MEKRRMAGWMAGLLLGLGAGGAIAATPGSGAAPGAGEEAAVTLGEVVVSGAAVGSLPTRSILSSVNILGADQIENQNIKSPWQLFYLMPGVMLTQYNMGTTSGKLSFRGFNGEGEVNAVKLLIDGIPSNSNDGNMPYLDLLFPLEIQSVELVKGTNDPRYGLHNIAGNANLTTDTGGNYTKSRVALGSFDSREVQLGRGVEGEGLSQNYFFGYQSANGWRAHDDSERYALSGKWFVTPNGGRTNLGLTFRAAKQKADEPGYLSQAQSDANPRMSPANNRTDGGERTMEQMSLQGDHQFNDRWFGALKAYVNHIDDRRWLDYGQGTTPQERAIQELHQGFIATLTWRPEVHRLYDLAIEGGVDGEWQQNQSQRYNINQRVRLAQTRDQRFDFNVAGAYLQAVIRPTEKLKIVPAYRVDKFNGNFTDRLTGNSYGMNDYGWIHQPKLSAMYTLVPGYSLYGNYGRTFQVGVGSGAYRLSQTGSQSPSLNDGWEVGLKMQPAAGTEARVALWQQVASDELRRMLYGAANDMEAVGKTRRQGMDWELSTQATEATRLWAFYSYQNSKILKAGAQEPGAQGQEIDHVPHYIVSAGVEHRLNADLRLTASLNAQGSSYLERTNTTAKYGAYTLVNVAANYRLDNHTSLDFQVQNLFDRRYEYVWYMSGETFHAPADGRAMFVALNLRY